MSKKLTSRQKELWEELKKSMQSPEDGSPTYKKLAEKLGVTSLATISLHLQALARKGYIQIMRGAHCGIKLLKTNEDQTLIRKPLLGTSAAGMPILAEENIEEDIEFDANAVNSIPDFFLKVKGDSMIGVGINNGDLVAVKQNVQVKDGDIVVYLVDNESTIKRFYHGNDCIILKPANDNYPNIIIKDTGNYSAVVGKVVGVLKNK